MGKTLARISAKTATEVCQYFELEEQTQELLHEDLSPADFLELLSSREQFAEAIRFLAYALPPRDAVWWLCLCARLCYGAEPEGQIKEALEAAERWVSEPNDAHRRSAMEAAEKAQFGAPAGCTGLAAFLSEGSIAPPNAPAVEPPPHQAAKVVAGGIILAGVLKEPEHAPEKYRQYLRAGISVANGTNLWDQGRQS